MRYAKLMRVRKTVTNRQELKCITKRTHVVGGVEKPLISITSRMTGDDTISRRIQAEAERGIQD